MRPTAYLVADKWVYPCSVDIIKKFISILSVQLYILLFGYISLHSVISVPNNSFIMPVIILLFQHYSCQVCNLLFLKSCQHHRLVQV